MKSTIQYLAVFFLLSVSAIAKTENQEAHVHGLATLTLALENEILEIQLESPAANLIGFEHKASSPEEKQTIKHAKTLLLSPAFSFNGTNCKPEQATVDISEVMGNAHDHHHDHDHYHHSEDHSDSSHSEITASYQFSCKDGKKLHSISVALFKQFPGIEKIKTVWITETRQGSEMLFPNRNTISLR